MACMIPSDYSARVAHHTVSRETVAPASVAVKRRFVASTSIQPVTI